MNLLHGDTKSSSDTQSLKSMMVVKPKPPKILKSRFSKNSLSVLAREGYSKPRAENTLLLIYRKRLTNERSRTSRLDRSNRQVSSQSMIL